MKLAQPVLLQSSIDEFDLPEGETPTAPAEAGQLSSKGKTEEELGDAEQTTCRSAVGKMLHVVRWSRPETKSAARELCKFMTGGAAWKTVKAACRAMKRLVGHSNCGFVMQPNAVWNGDPDFEFETAGKAGSNLAQDPDSRRSVSVLEWNSSCEEVKTTRNHFIIHCTI